MHGWISGFNRSTIFDDFYDSFKRLTLINRDFGWSKNLKWEYLKNVIVDSERIFDGYTLKIWDIRPISSHFSEVCFSFPNLQRTFSHFSFSFFLLKFLLIFFDFFKKVVYLKAFFKSNALFRDTVDEDDSLALFLR